MEWISPSKASQEFIRTWEATRAREPRWASPFFSSSFALKTQQHCPDLRVLYDDSGPVPAFWPLHPLGRSRYAPITHFMSDYQGPIGINDEASLRALMRQARVRLTAFDHVRVDQPGFEPWFIQQIASPLMDLTGGFDAYRDRLSGVQGVKVAGVFKMIWGQARRRIERDIGPVRFVRRDNSQQALGALLRWKSDQWVRTGGYASDRFAIPWVRSLVSDLTCHSSLDLEGWLSALYAGERILAVHLGLRSGRILHSWFPAYDVEMSTYSPGLLLLLFTAQAAAADGIEELDLGRGASPYKSRVMTGSRNVGIGYASSPALIGQSLRASRLIMDEAKSLLRPTIRFMKNVLGAGAGSMHSRGAAASEKE